MTSLIEMANDRDDRGAVATLIHPFRHRNAEIAELRRRVQNLTALVDDILDAWTALQAPAAVVAGTSVLTATSPAAMRVLVAEDACPYSTERRRQTAPNFPTGEPA